MARNSQHQKLHALYLKILTIEELHNRFKTREKLQGFRERSQKIPPYGLEQLP